MSTAEGLVKTRKIYAFYGAIKFFSKKPKKQLTNQTEYDTIVFAVITAELASVAQG